MFSSLKKFIATSLLVVLACSCSGLSLGMIGHEMQMESAEHVANATHDCCGITETGQEESSTATGINHHTPTVATLSFLDLLIALLVIFVAVALPEPARKIIISRFQLYIRTWLQQWSYFALYLRQLFSKGILHPKTW